MDTGGLVLLCAETALESKTRLRPVKCKVEIDFSIAAPITCHLTQLLGVWDVDAVWLADETESPSSHFLACMQPHCLCDLGFDGVHRAGAERDEVAGSVKERDGIHQHVCKRYLVIPPPGMGLRELMLRESATHAVLQEGEGALGNTRAAKKALQGNRKLQVKSLYQSAY